METLFVFLFLKVIQADASSWTLTVPSSVKGLPGSCVVIPCSYNYHDPGKRVTQFTGIWNDQTNRIIYHPVASKIMEQYRSRTEQLGDVTQKNCSLKIDPLLERDHGPFHFRIEIGNYSNFSYLQNKVSIKMISEPKPINFFVKEELEEGVNVSASCSVSHSCPTSPPEFTWSHSGQKQFQPKQLDNGQWEATSTLTFQPTRADNNKPLQCNVTYKGGQLQEKSKVLKVKYAPDIKSISSCSSDGEMVKCMCIVESKPSSTVHFLLSDRVLSSTKVEIFGPVTIGILQANLGSFGFGSFGFGSFGFVHCVANNTVGNANITLTLPYKSGMPTLYFAIAAGAGVVILVILIAVVVVKKCRGRSGDVPPSQMQTMTAQKTVAVPQYSTASRKKKYNGDVQYPNNDHIYGNMEAEWATDDDAIYANT